jgi:hypothetical protein
MNGFLVVGMKSPARGPRLEPNVHLNEALNEMMATLCRFMASGSTNQTPAQPPANFKIIIFTFHL